MATEMATEPRGVENRAGSTIKAVRGGKLSQRELAARMVGLGHSGWLQSTVAKTEAGERPLRLNEFVGLCRALDLNPLEVLGPIISSPAQELRFTELMLAHEYARKNAERLTAEREAALREMQTASADLDAFMAANPAAQ